VSVTLYTKEVKVVFKPFTQSVNALSKTNPGAVVFCAFGSQTALLFYLLLSCFINNGEIIFTQPISPTASIPAKSMGSFKTTIYSRMEEFDQVMEWRLR
jgi:hypothetical protein